MSGRQSFNRWSDELRGRQGMGGFQDNFGGGRNGGGFGGQGNFGGSPGGFGGPSAGFGASPSLRGGAGLMSATPQVNPAQAAASQLLSQISSPEAQLALASNLLNSILRPQQQQQQQQQLMPPAPVQSNSLMDPSPKRMRMDLPPQFERGGPIGFQNRFPNRDEGFHNREQIRSRGSFGPGNRNTNRMLNRDVEARKFPRRDDRPKEKPTPPKAKVEADIAARYKGIPNVLFYCHMCKKHMYDAVLFDNHINGDSHVKVMEKMDQYYNMRTDLMRFEAQIGEQLRGGEVGMRRGRFNEAPETCNMCDIQVNGQVFIHRKALLHQRLKNFLHPKCTACARKFHSRIEYDRHMLTPSHLKVMAGRREKKIKSGQEEKEEDVLLQMVAINLFDFNLNSELHSDEEADDADEKDQKEALDRKGPYIFSQKISIGQDVVDEASGFYCRMCKKFYYNEKDGKTGHCRSRLHQENYNALLRMKNYIANRIENLASGASGDKKAVNGKGKTVVAKKVVKKVLVNSKSSPTTPKKVTAAKEEEKPAAAKEKPKEEPADAEEECEEGDEVLEEVEDEEMEEGAGQEEEVEQQEEEEEVKEPEAKEEPEEVVEEEEKSPKLRRNVATRGKAIRGGRGKK